MSQFRKFSSLTYISSKPKSHGFYSFFCRGTVIGDINRGCDDPIVAKQIRVKGKDIVGTYATLTTSISNA